MPKVVITDYNFPDVDIEQSVFENAGIDLEVAQLSSTAEVIEFAQAEKPDALLIQYVQITDDVFEALPNLKIVAKYGIGVDNIDVESATAHDTMVVNVPSYCKDEVPEHALALMFACERQIPQFDRAIEAGEWDWKQGKPMYRIAGRTLGIVGFGRIGSSLAEKASGLGLDVIAHDPYLADDDVPDGDIELVSKDELLQHADFVSLHTPLTSETEQFIDTEALSKMKETAILVNTSRGGVVDDEALANALETGGIRAAGMDVLPNEPPDDSSLTDLHNAILTPHVAWYSEDSLVTLRRTVAEYIVEGLAGEIPAGLVNTSLDE